MTWLSIARGAIAAVFAYANVVVIVSLYTGPLPIPGVLRDAFLIFGVFSYFQTENQDYTLWGLPDGGSTSDWRLLPVAEYVPFDRGERASRLWTSRHSRLGGADGQRDAWRFLGERIRERHNRMHPRAPIAKVALQVEWWPRDSAGFFALRDESARRRHWILVE